LENAGRGTVSNMTWTVLVASWVGAPMIDFCEAVDFCDVAAPVRLSEASSVHKYKYAFGLTRIMSMAFLATLLGFASAVQAVELPRLTTDSVSSSLQGADHPARADLTRSIDYPDAAGDSGRGIYPDSAYSELREFAQQIGPEQPRPAIAAAVSSDDDDYSTLRQFVREISIQDPELVTAGPVGASDRGIDGAYAALREFAQQTNPHAMHRTADYKVAEADSLFSAIQQLLDKGSSDQPSTGDASKTVPKTPSKTPSKAAAKAAKPAGDATIVGTPVCLGCHTTQAASFGDTLMGRTKQLACETCHGPGSAHAKAGGGRGVGGIISFRSDDQTRTAEDNNGICLGCHEKGDRTYWDGSAHEARGLACTNCHTIMKHVSVKFQLKTAFQPDTCFQCHKDRRAQMFRSSHMPVREGKVVCSDCHNPHGSATEALLKEPSINETCYKCHAEKRGPFLFEHTPVRENCDNCHEPHGSVNQFLLKVSRPRLCVECHFGSGFGHGQNAGPLSAQTVSRQCENCHNQIHGTNSPAGALLQR
jgi:DmsE family decaheme c-type cytochrome